MSASSVPSSSSPNLLDLQYREIDRISSHLDLCSLTSLSFTCRKLYLMTNIKVQQIYEQLFREKYGSISMHERMISSTASLYGITRNHLDLYRHYENILWDKNLSFSEILSIPFVHINVDHLSKTHKSSPAVQLYNPLECTPGTCNRLYHEIVAEMMKRMLRYHKHIYREFLIKPLHQGHPLQDLRDRCCRIMVLEKIRMIHYLWAEMHLIQQEAFKVKQSLGKTAPNLYASIQLPEDDHMKFNDFVRSKRHYFSRRTITHNGVLTSVTISGTFPAVSLSPKEQLTRKFAPETTFQIRNVETDELLGSITFIKCWNVVGDEEVVHELSEMGSRKIEPCYLSASQIFLSSEELQGDCQYPILRLLLQISVELLLRENFPALKVTTYSNLGGVFHAGGFRGNYHNTKILEQLRQAREGDKKLFIPFDFLPKDELWILKPSEENFDQQSLFNPKTQIYNSIDGHLHPVIVKSDLHTLSCFWEQIIYSKAKPLLGNEREPVLPNYHHRDLKDHLLPRSIDTF